MPGFAALDNPIDVTGALLGNAQLLGSVLPIVAGLAYERRAFELCFATEDRREGMRAFLQKRTPAFEGR